MMQGTMSWRAQRWVWACTPLLIHRTATSAAIRTTPELRIIKLMSSSKQNRQARRQISRKSVPASKIIINQWATAVGRIQTITAEDSMGAMAVRNFNLWEYIQKKGWKSWVRYIRSRKSVQRGIWPWQEANHMEDVMDWNQQGRSQENRTMTQLVVTILPARSASPIRQTDPLATALSAMPWPVNTGNYLDTTVSPSGKLPHHSQTIWIQTSPATRPTQPWRTSSYHISNSSAKWIESLNRNNRKLINFIQN